MEELEKFEILVDEDSGYSISDTERLLLDGIKENRNKINEIIKKINELTTEE